MAQLFTTWRINRLRKLLAQATASKSHYRAAVYAAHLDLLHMEP